MKAVVFAGGLGSRLWPLTRKNLPKSFLKIIGDETPLENSLQGIYKTFKKEDVYISASITDKESILTTLPDLSENQLILEPCVKGNGPGVAYAMTRLAEKYPNEPVVIRWTNSVVKDNEMFAKILDVAKQMIEHKEANLVFVAAKSKYPNPNVGYIHLANSKITEDVEIGDFLGFVEKPKLEKAIEYQKAGGYSWDTGFYVTTPQYILGILEQYQPEYYKRFMRIKESFGKENESEVTRREFEEMETIAVDYLLWENLKPEGVNVLVGDYGWSYISTWGQLKKALEENEKEIVTKGLVKPLESENSLVYNMEEGKLISLVGAKDLVVVNTKDALLITTIDEAQKVKDLVNELKADKDLGKFCE